MANSVERLQSVSGLWNGTAAQPMSSAFPAGLPTGTLSSPQQVMRHGHSRVNSASSMRSKTSQHVGDSWSSLESGGNMQPPVNGMANGGIADGYTNFSESNTVSPLLFGAGGGIWSTGATNGGYTRKSPQNGHIGQSRPSG